MGLSQNFSSGEASYVQGFDILNFYKIIYIKVKTISRACNITVKRALIKVTSEIQILTDWAAWGLCGCLWVMPGRVPGLTRGFYVPG
jgi:hypothetical protein